MNVHIVRFQVVFLLHYLDRSDNGGFLKDRELGGLNFVILCGLQGPLLE